MSSDTSQPRASGPAPAADDPIPSSSDLPAPGDALDGDPLDGDPLGDDPLGDDPLDSGSGSEALALAGILTLTGGWFGVSWLVLGSPWVDAVGEAAGGVVALLVVVSVVGAIRHSRRSRTPRR